LTGFADRQSITASTKIPLSPNDFATVRFVSAFSGSETEIPAYERNTQGSARTPHFSLHEFFVSPVNRRK